MRAEIADAIVEQFERGHISRRQLASRLMGLGAALAAAMPGTARAEEGTFQATGLDHIALDVQNVPRSRDFYIKHLGLEVLRDGGEDNCFLGRGGGFFLTLFRGERPGLNHYCYRIGDFDPDEVVRKLKNAGIEPRREQDRVYFDDPDGIEVQVSGS
jgi:catechol 2,3-dioxygenase-like lactoylglutathione lyase family enzyme